MASRIAGDSDCDESEASESACVPSKRWKRACQDGFSDVSVATVADSVSTVARTSKTQKHTSNLPRTLKALGPFLMLLATLGNLEPCLDGVKFLLDVSP